MSKEDMEEAGGEVRRAIEEVIRAHEARAEEYKRVADELRNNYLS